MANKVVFKFKDSTANTINLNVQSKALKASADLSGTALKTIADALVTAGYGKTIKVKTENEDGTTTTTTADRVADTAVSASYVEVSEETVATASAE